MLTTPRILAVGAHPDDIELGCGATLAKLADRGCEIRALILTDGLVGLNQHASTDRHIETREALADLGVFDVHLERFADTSLPAEINRMVSTIEWHIGDFNPDRIYTMYAQDRHQDHRAVYDATLIAGRSVGQILSYETPSSWPNFQPIFFESVPAPFLERKVRALSRHKSQAHRGYMQEEEVRARAIFRGSQVGSGPAEGFEVYKLVA